MSVLPGQICTADRRCGLPLFVVGVWRSGTTLLQLLLNQHPEIALFYEGDLPVLWPMFAISYSRKKWVEKWEYWNSAVSRHHLDPQRIAVPLTTLAEAAEVAGREYARRKGAHIWGCKSPSYYDRLVYLAREFPNARFIVIWRDPEEICRSVMEAAPHSSWFSRPGMTLRAILACEILKNQCDTLRDSGVPVHQIHYQDLVEKTTTTMNGICEFLQIPFVPAITVLDGVDRSALFDGAHHAMAHGSKIVSLQKRPGALPPRLAHKIRRYKALWKADDCEWLLCQRLSECRSPKAGAWERFTDRLLVGMLRIIDEVPRVAYSISPISVWQAYRFLKYGDRQYVLYRATQKQTDDKAL
ncbi:MAG: hypothetical protein JWO91_1128 [Acidobacteriaceae bacterium]|nr:hypothetical protein [Acidobacteriaceae bacterium]